MNENKPTSIQTSTALDGQVTVVLVPYEQYSTFPKAVDALYERTDRPFQLILIEGNAPERIRTSLERRKKYRKNIKIIYTDHLPLAGEARNLALPHLRTPFVFFMDNDVRVTNGWLSNLIRCSTETGAEIVYPSILNTQNPIYTFNGGGTLQENMDINAHGFLITKKALDRIGKFDENANAFTLGLDLGLKAKANNIEVRLDTKTWLRRDFVFSGSPQDVKLFRQQWDLGTHQRSLSHLKHKWDIELDERKYLDWLQIKSQNLKYSTKPYSVKGIKDHLQYRLNSARINLSRLLHTFISL